MRLHIQNWYETSTIPFKNANLEIVYHDMHLSQRLITFWDIGLRPLSPVLIKMANNLGTIKREEAKEEWIGICSEICKPFLEDELRQKDNTFHLFVLKKI